MNKEPEPPTYYNDKDLQEIISCQKIDEQKVITFFVKKGGKVNITNFTYLVHEYAADKTGLYQILVDMETSGKMKYITSHIAKLTWKARWQRIYSNPVWQFWAAITTILALLLSIAAICLSLLQKK